MRVGRKVSGGRDVGNDGKGDIRVGRGGQVVNTIARGNSKTL